MLTSPRMKRFWNKRRVAGTIFLGISILLLALGETVFKHQLTPVATLVYWTACLLATLGAILCALLDLGRSFRQSHDEQRALLEGTLREIEAERARRKNSPEHSGESR